MIRKRYRPEPDDSNGSVDSDGADNDASERALADYFVRPTIPPLLRLCLLGLAGLPWIGLWASPPMRRFVPISVSTRRAQLLHLATSSGLYMFCIAAAVSLLGVIFIVSLLTDEDILKRVSGAERYRLVKILLACIACKTSAFLASLVFLRWGLTRTSVDGNNVGKLSLAKDTLARLYPVGEMPALDSYLDPWRVALIPLTIAFFLLVVFDLVKFVLISSALNNGSVLDNQRPEGQAIGKS